MSTRPLPPKIWTIQELIAWCTAYFRDREILDSPRLDAELLLARVLGVKRLDLYLKFDQPLTDAELSAFKQLVKRRAAREPVALILGEKEFYGRRFKVNEHTLVPRPDTETLITAVLGECRNQPRSLQGLDVGTGSGCIAITLVSEIPNLIMTALDVSAPTLKGARANAAELQVEDRVEFLHLDILQESPPRKFDFIVSNPPYIATTEIEKLAPEISRHEPHGALDGGTDGLKFYHRLAQIAGACLSDKGFIAVEIGDDEAQAVRQIFSDAGLSEIRVIQDFARQDRVVVGKYRLPPTGT